VWYLTDKLGSVREDVQTSGSVLDSITYDSYGNILTESSPSSGDRFKFTGREWDSEIGQYYDRARDYAPNIGRFESEDPAGFKGQDSNLYRYVYNQPTDLIDPTGLEGISPNRRFYMRNFGKMKPPPKPLKPTNAQCENHCRELYIEAEKECLKEFPLLPRPQWSWTTPIKPPQPAGRACCIAVNHAAYYSCLLACNNYWFNAPSPDVGEAAFIEAFQDGIKACGWISHHAPPPWGPWWPDD
jgi:RHS repeat-associated protein